MESVQHHPHADKADGIPPRLKKEQKLPVSTTKNPLCSLPHLKSLAATQPALQGSASTVSGSEYIQPCTYPQVVLSHASKTPNFLLLE